MTGQTYKLLAEVVDASEMNYLIESKENSPGKTYRIRGHFIQCNMKNRNGRTYLSETVDPEVNNYRTTMIDKHRSIGGAKHPSQAALDWDQAALLTESLTKVDGGHYFGVAKILSTNDGQMLKCLMDDGVLLSVSTRSLGSTNSEGIVNPNFKLLATDAVVMPSSYISEVESIYENFSYYVNGDVITEIALNNFKKDLSKNGSRNLAEDLGNFIKTLRRKI